LTTFIPSGQSIYIGWGLLKFESLYRDILSLRQDILGILDQENHPPAFGWGIELLIIERSS
jgi:hypothetical protein